MSPVLCGHRVSPPVLTSHTHRLAPSTQSTSEGERVPRFGSDSVLLPNSEQRKRFLSLFWEFLKRVRTFTKDVMAGGGTGVCSDDPEH